MTCNHKLVSVAAWRMAFHFNVGCAPMAIFTLRAWMWVWIWLGVCLCLCETTCISESLSSALEVSNMHDWFKVESGVTISVHPSRFFIVCEHAFVSSVSPLIYSSTFLCYHRDAVLSIAHIVVGGCNAASELSISDTHERLFRTQFGFGEL